MDDWTPPVTSDSDDVMARASTYAHRRALTLDHRLGFGKDGIILATSMATATKVFRAPRPFQRELACYLRLRDHAVFEVLGHHVPQLIAWDEDLLVVEMSTVTKPFLLDFADGYLDDPPQFTEEVMAQWDLDKQEQFGDRWIDAQTILAFLRSQYGIHVLDVNPGNITFQEPAAGE
jgi:hypothetical protein